MNTYPYEGRDLFEQPEDYFYAPCGDPGFIDTWRKSRDRAATRLQAAIAQNPAGEKERGSAGTGKIELLGLLRAMRDGLNSGSTDYVDAVDTIEPFVMKYEVFKRLHSHYGTDLRRATNAQPASIECYVAFAECLRLLARGGNGLRYVSTLLKICDALCAQSAERFARETAGRLIAVLDDERLLISELGG